MEAVERSSGEAERHQRSDAQRNRRRLLEAAAAVFGERGLEAGVGEIAARAGVGRGTLFRNFPTKQDLIAAIVVDRMHGAIAFGRELLESGDDAEIVFEFVSALVSRQQSDRALFEAVSDAFLAQPEIRAAHAEFIAVVDELLARGRAAGSVRPEIGALDVVMLVKGVCSAAAALDSTPEMLARHVDLIRAAIASPGYAVAIRGQAPTLAELEATVAEARTRAADADADACAPIAGAGVPDADAGTPVAAAGAPAAVAAVKPPGSTPAAA
jgi:AcrR family transcriptional regulator